MRVVFTPSGWDDFCWWQEKDATALTRLISLINDARRHPFTGLGKPEPLREELRGYWSRRIDREHRLIYQVGGKDHDQQIEIIRCRFHYHRK